MWKKTLLTASLLATLLPVTSLAFSDVDTSNPFNEAIVSLQAMGVVKGYPDGSFGINDNLSRAEALKIVVQTFDSVQFESFTPPTSLSYPDVSLDNWFYSYVAYAQQTSVAKGFSDGSFQPLEKITMAEAIKLLHVLSRGFELETSDSELWYGPYQKWAIENGLILFDQNGELPILEPLTRGEFADIVYRAYLSFNDLAEDTEVKTAVQTALVYNWTDVYLDEVKFYVPYFWEQQELTDGFSTYIRDPYYSQVFIPTLYPLSASMTIEQFPKSGRSPQEIADSLLNELVDLYGTGVQIIEIDELDSSFPRVIYKIPEVGRMDTYYFTDDHVYVFHGRYGSGSKEEQFKLILSSIVNSVELNDSGVKFTATSVDESVEVPSGVESEYQEITGLTLAERSTLARESILQPDTADFVLGLFPDIDLIEIDSIGIGTGPVDYYYTVEADFTLKIERDSNVVLDLQPGRTTEF